MHLNVVTMKQATWYIALLTFESCLSA